MEIRKGQQNGGLHYGKWKQEPTPDSRRKTDHRRRDKQRVKQGSDSRNLREGKVARVDIDQILISVRVKEENVEIAKEALRRASMKKLKTLLRLETKFL